MEGKGHINYDGACEGSSKQGVQCHQHSTERNNVCVCV